MSGNAPWQHYGEYITGWVFEGSIAWSIQRGDVNSSLQYMLSYRRQPTHHEMTADLHGRSL